MMAGATHALHACVQVCTPLWAAVRPFEVGLLSVESPLEGARQAVDGALIAMDPKICRESSRDLDGIV